MDRGPEVAMSSLRHVSVIVWGGSFALLVASDGSWGWMLARLMVVGVSMAALLAVEPRHIVCRWCDLAAGTVGIIVGAGIGVPHLIRRGDAIRSVFGSLALVAGAALFVLAVSALVGHRRRWAGAGAWLTALVWLAVTSFVAVPALMATNMPPIRGGNATPASFGIMFEDVRFPTADGFVVAAWYVPSSNGAGVVLRHGAGSTRDDVLEQLRVLAAHGYGVLATDARGHGASDGRAMEFGWYGDADVSAAVDFLTVRSDVEPERIGIVGMSMGGEEAIGAAAADPRIRAVVAEGASGRTAADDAWLSDVYGLRGAIQEGLGRARTGLTRLLTSAPLPTPLADAVASSTQAWFLLIAAGDVADERHVAERLRSMSPQHVEVWIVHGADHTDGLSVAAEPWESTVIGFLDDALRNGAT